MHAHWFLFSAAVTLLQGPPSKFFILPTNFSILPFLFDILSYTLESYWLSISWCFVLFCFALFFECPEHLKISSLKS